MSTRSAHPVQTSPTPPFYNGEYRIHRCGTAAWAPVTQQAQVWSPVRTSFLGEVFSGFFLTCKTTVRKLQAPQGPRISFGHHYHHHHSSFITGANDLRCWRALKPQIYIHTRILLLPLWLHKWTPFQYHGFKPRTISCHPYTIPPDPFSGLLVF